MNTQPNHGSDPDAGVEYLRQSLEGANKVIREYRAKIKELQGIFFEWKAGRAQAAPILSGDARYREAEATITDLRARLSSSEARLNKKTSELNLKEEEHTHAKMRCLELESQREFAVKTMTRVVHGAESSFDESKKGSDLAIQCERAQQGLEDVALKGRGFLHKTDSVMQSGPKQPKSYAELKPSFHTSRESEKDANQRKDTLKSGATPGKKLVTDHRSATHAPSTPGPESISEAAGTGAFWSPTATHSTVQRAPATGSVQEPVSRPFVTDAAQFRPLFQSTGDGTAASKKVDLAPANLISTPTRSKMTPEPPRLTPAELRKNVFVEGAARETTPLPLSGSSDFEPKLDAPMQKEAKHDESDDSDDSDESRKEGHNLPPVGKKRKSTGLDEDGARKRARSQAVDDVTESLSTDDEEDIPAESPPYVSIFSGPKWEAFCRSSETARENGPETKSNRKRS